MLKETAEARPTRRYVEKREAILDAAARLFNRKGLRGATLSDVAQEVGLSTNSITYYYRKKEDLVVACLMRTIDEMAGIADATADEPGPEARVRRFIALFFERLARTATGERPELMSFREIRSLPDTHADVAFKARYRHGFRRIRKLLRAETPQSPAQRSALSAAAHSAAVAHQRRDDMGRALRTAGLPESRGNGRGSAAQRLCVAFLEMGRHHSRLATAAGDRHTRDNSGSLPARRYRVTQRTGLSRRLRGSHFRAAESHEGIVSITTTRTRTT
ncbi:TetR/AcrR family transcriptional regulator [Cupriavidus basilensis]